MPTYREIEETFVSANDALELILIEDSDLEEKIYRASQLIRVIEDYYSYLKEYQKKITELKQLGNIAKSSIRDYVTDWLVQIEKKIVEKDGVRVTLRVYKDKVVVDDENTLPGKYKKSKTSIKNTVDKKILQKDLKDGQDLNGSAHLEDVFSVVVS